jgi:pimeloyl-ACP methyl ester carboxylesterase
VILKRDGGIISDAILQTIWNQEDHATLLEVVPTTFRIDDAIVQTKRRGPLLLLDLMNLYKSLVPDLRFTVAQRFSSQGSIVTDWSATGHHYGVAMQKIPSGRRLQLHGRLVVTPSRRGFDVAGTWDCAGLMHQIALDRTAFLQNLSPPLSQTRIRAIECRKGTPVVLFPTVSLPGWITWRRFMAPLSKRAPVITFQLHANRRAFERRSVKSYSIAMEGRALQRALESAGVSGPYHLVGHSLGGNLALDFALDNSQQVRSLTLIEPGTSWVLKKAGRFSSDFKRFVRNRIKSYQTPVTKHNYAKILQRVALTKGYDPRKSPFWRQFCAYMHNVQFRPAFYRHSDSIERIRSARFPVLMIQGAEAHPFHREIVEVLRAELCNVRFVEIPGGHVPHHGKGMTPFLSHLDHFHAKVDQAWPALT